MQMLCTLALAACWVEPPAAETIEVMPRGACFVFADVPYLVLDNPRRLPLDVAPYREGWFAVRGGGCVATSQVVPLSEAVEYYTRCIEQRPTASAFAMRAISRFKSDVAHAAADLQRAVALRGSIEEYLLYSIALVQQARIEEAGTAINAGTTKHPTSFELRLLRTRLNINRDRWEDAEADCRVLTDLRPESGEAWLLLGVCLHMQGKEEGRKFTLKGIILDPQRAGELGVTYSIGDGPQVPVGSAQRKRRR